ncbi:jg20568 [Pararge aegeria aegeria]|uniref:Jg20568 protein n=1 Tax=Pararge aegeria aegeria TaxID=348720 RepID=A0A8S4QJ06_9NEOP|nr:jg20568 [Pararge aegeria aegeria]
MRREKNSLERIIVAGNTEGKKTRGRSPTRWADQLKKSNSCRFYQIAKMTSNRTRWRLEHGRRSLTGAVSCRVMSLAPRRVTGVTRTWPAASLRMQSAQRVTLRDTSTANNFCLYRWHNAHAQNKTSKGMKGTRPANLPPCGVKPHVSVVTPTTAHSGPERSRAAWWLGGQTSSVATTLLGLSFPGPQTLYSQLSACRALGLGDVRAIAAAHDESIAPRPISGTLAPQTDAT